MPSKLYFGVECYVTCLQHKLILILHYTVRFDEWTRREAWLKVN